MVKLLAPKRRSLHATITPAFGLSLVLFFLVAAQAFRGTNRLVTAGQRVSQANEVLTKLATTSTYFERAETEAQLYNQSGETPHLDQMRTDMAQTIIGMREITEATTDSPAQQHSMNRINALVVGEFEALRSAADARLAMATAQDEAVIAPPVEHDLTAIASIRDLFEQMRAEESFLVRERTGHVATEIKSRNWAFGGMAGAVLLAIALSYCLVLEFEKHCRNSEKQLQKAKETAESASSFKSSFLASMSHEIRTPMTAVIGFADLLLRSNLSENERIEYVQTVRRNGAHLLTIINDILDLSKIEAGKMEVEKISCTPAQIVEDVVGLLKPRATEKAIAFDVQYVGPCPETIQTDPTRLRQILTNLVGNALKFTERGSIRMFVQLAPSTDGVSRLQFRITDTGAGMTPEQAKNLFTAFQQADSSITRKFGGTGLGLTISKQFAQMLGGDITVASQVGAGSTFVVEVATGPLDAVRLLDAPKQEIRRATEQPTVPGQLPKFSGRVLLAEDGLTNQQLISLYLKEQGAEVTLADNGKIAFEKVEAAAKAGTPFHLILMDMEMPEMDGCEATRRLRNHGYKLPIVALTANAMSADRDMCMTAGCNAFATKPIDWPRLLELVASYLKNIDITGSRQDDPHLARVLQIFMTELELVENNLRKSVANNDRERLAKLAHALKGTAGNCGFTTLAQLASDVAHAARGNMAPEMLNRQAEALIDLISRSRVPKAAA
jgi:signal transduction histidine kinase/DNA-binding response OmpR family regulator